MYHLDIYDRVPLKRSFFKDARLQKKQMMKDPFKNIHGLGHTVQDYSLI